MYPNPEAVAEQFMAALRSQTGGAWVRIFVAESEVIRLWYPPTQEHLAANPNNGMPPPDPDVLSFTNIPS